MNTKDEDEYTNFIIELEGEDGDVVRAYIMEHASDTAEQLCELECKVAHIKCYNTTYNNGTEESTFTKEAQEIFNEYYDEQTKWLYRLLYNQLKILDYE